MGPAARLVPFSGESTTRIERPPPASPTALKSLTILSFYVKKEGMAQNLVIVESPAKAKTISHILGKGFTVKASMGHVRDLPKSKIGIDVKHDFEPTYIVPMDKRNVIRDLQKEVKKNTKLWIATDEDREGEAIGWHLLQALKFDAKKNPVKRIVFHEITESAIKNSVEHFRDIDKRLVDAQQARRVLDRLVGYELSPLLWKKIRYGLSAGRVQSVAVRLIVEREREIENFKPQEYWEIFGNFLTKKKEEFEAKLSKVEGKNADLRADNDAKSVVEALEGASYKVKTVEQKEVHRTAAPPFITSTLQQEASRKLGFSVKKTMMVAQQLYEGVEIEGESKALITYMRTDSTNLSDVALKQAKQVIEKMFGKEFALASPRRYRSRKGAQEAHEAIRPVDLSILPQDTKLYLNKDQLRLYELIWKRTLACQMAEAILNNVGVDIVGLKGGSELPYVFRATGQTIVFPGFMRVYVEGSDSPEEELEKREKLLPVLHEGEDVKLRELLPSQHFTKPPSRYTEAALVKKLESEGIGRPSTYAPTISTVMTRGYVEKENKFLRPTDLGKVVTDMLVQHFPEIVDYKFTAEMEESLDDIAEGKKEWVPVISEFYGPFHSLIEKKSETIQRSEVVSEKSEEVCEQCGSPMVIKLGRFGKFLSCSNYPKCKNARPLQEKAAEKTEEFKELEKKFTGKKCDKCGQSMQLRTGKYGSFLGCSGYPKCRNIQSIVKFAGMKCPKCGQGQVIERRTRKSHKVFYGCNSYPKCDYASWTKPDIIPQP